MNTLNALAALLLVDLSSGLVAPALAPRATPVRMAEDPEELEMELLEVMESMEDRMKKSVASVTEQLATLRVGRATPDMLARVEEIGLRHAVFAAIGAAGIAIAAIGAGRPVGAGSVILAEPGRWRLVILLVAGRRRVIGPAAQQMRPVMASALLDRRFDAETLFPVDEKLLGWITAGANISVAANASLNPMATRAAAASWSGVSRRSSASLA